MKPQIQLIDPSFQSQSSEKCDLLIHIGSSGIAYAIINAGDKKLNILSEISLPNNETETIINTLSDLIDNNDDLKMSYNRVIVCMESYKYTFIPSDLYSKNNLSAYAKLINPEVVEEIAVNEIKQFEITNIFSVNASISKKVLSSFPNATITHQANAFLNGSLTNLKDGLSSQLFINIQDCNFEIALYFEMELQLYNLYEYKTIDEFNYFLLAIISQFHLNRITTNAILSGKINPGEDLYLRIQKYFKNIKLANSDAMAERNYIFHRVQSHTYFSLFSLVLCE
jgi:hypothetical protein